MIKHLTILCLFLSIGFTSAQECDCSKDFTQLDELLRKTPAYKDHKKAYNQKFDALSKEAKSVETDFQCLLLLNKLTLGVNDNHIKVFGLGEEKRIDSDKVSIDLDSLQRVLQKKPLNTTEGIYSLPNYVTVGIYKQKENYLGVVLASELPNWEKGEIIYAFQPFGKDLFLCVFGQAKSKRFVAVSERIKNGLFLKLGIKKRPDIKAVHRPPHRDSLFIKKDLNDNITYVKAGSFDSFYPVLAEAEAFYKTLVNNLNKPHLIVDLRDNTGGGQRNSNILLELLKTYTATKKLYVLTNHNTASNAEQFTVKLKALPNTIVLGDHTLGTLAYEKKKNVSNELSCDKFIAIMTSKRHRAYLPYESVGVAPDVLLNYDEDWLKQVVQFINSND